jgi:hypothetical protein
MWVSIGETSGVGGRFVANAVVGTLKHEQPGEMFLLACEVRFCFLNRAFRYYMREKPTNATIINSVY